MAGLDQSLTTLVQITTAMVSDKLMSTDASFETLLGCRNLLFALYLIKPLRQPSLSRQTVMGYTILCNMGPAAWPMSSSPTTRSRVASKTSVTLPCPIPQANAVKWEETHDNTKLTLMRNLYGISLPMQLTMERKIVAKVSQSSTRLPSTDTLIHRTLICLLYLKPTSTWTF